MGICASKFRVYVSATVGICSVPQKTTSQMLSPQFGPIER
jgi:hypothetical protein